MNARSAACLLAILFASAAISADKARTDPAPPRNSACVNQCVASEQRCSRDVRRARAACERVAASGGRNVFTGRSADGYNGVDYAAFCGYFANPEKSCRPGYYRNSCQQRLAYRHGICLQAMDNIASLRYDCFRTERDANSQCRADLQDCKAACE